MLRNVITQLAPAQPAPVEPAPNSATFVTQSFDAQVSVTLPEGTSDADILAALREQYEAAAQTQYPGARINPATRPGIRAGNWQAGEPVNGQITYTADMFGSIDIPQ